MSILDLNKLIPYLDPASEEYVKILKYFKQGFLV